MARRLFKLPGVGDFDLGTDGRTVGVDASLERTRGERTLGGVVQQAVLAGRARRTDDVGRGIGTVGDDDRPVAMPAAAG